MALTGSTNEEKVWNYLKAKGLSDYACAGFLGNFYAESGIIFNRVEILCLNRLKENGKIYNDETYTAAVDSGKISRAEFLNPLPNKQYGYGLIQLTSPTRKSGLYDLCKQRGVSIADAEAQLDYLWIELNGNYTHVLSRVKSATSVKEASDIVLKKFEIPANASALSETRAKYSQRYYDEFAGKTTTTAKKETATVTKETAIQTVIDVAKGELGYLEKASNSNLDDKTANAGYGNYTKYWRDIYSQYQAQAWCAVFVTWCFVKAFGKETATKLLKHYPYVYCPTMATLFTLNANPKVGDIVIFYRNGVFAHTGIVIAVNGDKFTTIEGNTSAGSSIVPNGGGVYEKSYYNSNLPGTKFCTPDYSIVTSVNSNTISSTTNTSTSSNTDSINNTVKWNGKVTADELNVRTWAGTQNEICSFSPLHKGDIVGVCDTKKDSSGSDWYFIKYNDKYGFVSAKYVSNNDTGTTTKKTTTETTKKANNNGIEYADYLDKNLKGTYRVSASDGLNLRSGAGTNYKILATMPNKSTVNCYGYYSICNGVKWYYLTYNGLVGFASSNYLKKL